MITVKIKRERQMMRNTTALESIGFSNIEGEVKHNFKILRSADWILILVPLGKWVGRTS